MQTFHIKQEYSIHGKPERVFDALTTKVDTWWNHGFASPQSVFRIEPWIGGRFFEDFGEEKEGALFATITYIRAGAKLKMTGLMGMAGALIGTISYELEQQGDITLLKLSHQVIGELDDEDTGRDL